MAISIIATGDTLITQRLPYRDESLIQLKKIFEDKDIRFTNFEFLVHDFEVSPAAVSGGTWVAARPPVIQDLKWLGFNLFACATNHALDWGHEGLQKTMMHLDRSECIYAGIGNNMAEACQPKYVDTPEGRVALISVSSTGRDWHIAGEQRPDVMGRPGINMLRFKAVHYLPKHEIDMLKSIVNKTDVNARRMQLEREGFVKPEEGFAIGNIRFEVGDTGTVTTYHQKDADRIVKAIQEAKRQADVVLVSHHVHEFKGPEKDISADFARDFARLCIDSGAHAYLGHGPHILRGFEVYQHRPIFYSLGDFIIQNDSVERQPAEFYDLYDLGPEQTPSDAFDARSGNGTKGLAANQKVFESVMAAFNVEDDRITCVELIPITLGFHKKRSRKGRPELASREDGERILKNLQQLSDEYQTKIEIKDGRGYLYL
ncbi:CapA family protein [Fusibacter paucivorans]|uniref:CapA family protein n=1 Tax=Fusibacter paucivorans TaxID=76009 RepID=A0ABS5PP17_9FIRM|nr:CapA family protein [Fusibacter paucivorans]MBS7526915.1 CapA family protein [Fusibacter paucivorans]